MKEYVQASQFETSHLEDEWIIVNTDDFTVTRLNEVGGFCWSLLQEPHSVETMIEKIKQNFATENEEIQIEEIDVFLQELVQCGLVRHAG